MTGLIEETSPLRHRPHSGYRSDEEIAIREAVDAWGRVRWPEARVVHELVMGRGEVRADMAFISPAHIAGVEIKSSYDVSARLIHQAGMFQLAVPEVWIIASGRNYRDGVLVSYLLPSLGLAKAVPADPAKRYAGQMKIEVVKEPGQFVPHPEAMLSLLWVAELAEEAARARVWMGKGGTHAKLVQAMMKLTPEEQMAAVCRQLRRRQAQWRADPPARQ